MKLHRFFPTSVGLVNDTEFTNKVLPIAREVLYEIGKEDHFLGYKTTYFRDNESIKLNNISFIKDYIKELSSKFISSLGFEWIGEIGVSIFVTKMEKGDKHDLHMHPNCILSGACYLNTSKNCSPITFEDPRDVRSFNSLIKKGGEYSENTTLDNQHEVTYLPKNGDILIWESWLKHRVKVNNCNRRETLIFNVFNI